MLVTEDQGQIGYYIAIKDALSMLQMLFKLREKVGFTMGFAENLYVLHAIKRTFILETGG